MTTIAGAKLTKRGRSFLRGEVVSDTRRTKRIRKKREAGWGPVDIKS